MEVVSRGNQYFVRSFTAPNKDPGLASSGARDGAKQQQQQPHRRNPSAMSNPNAAASPQAHTSSQYSIRSQMSDRSSSATQGTTTSTLFPPPPLPPLASFAQPAAGGNAPNGHGHGHGHGGDVTATDNIMNSVADASSSLFQICVALRQRLLGVPGINEALSEEEEDADDDTDPVTLLWRTFRRGYPLVLLYNALRPTQPLTMQASVKEAQRGKAATFKFLQACMKDLHFPQEELFIITDLFGDDTTGFVKVARVVNRVLDVLVSQGLIQDVRPTAAHFEQAVKGVKRTQRQHIVSELVTTERTYVQHLELLQSFKHLVEEKGIIPGDAIHDIFLNLNSLLDFQRRFLIRVEQINAQPEESQNWGHLFLMYCDAFKVYEPYISNQRKCEKTVVAEFSKLKDAGGSQDMRQMVESSTSLYGFLMKPFQRLSKYPLLLEDLYKKGDLDEERKQDLIRGKEAATSVLSRTNEAIDREEKAEAVQELKHRVEDWKGHRVEGFGTLLLYGTFTVLKSENLASGKEGERQYHVYLFETILLCCKNIDPSKAKNRLANRNAVDSKEKPKLQLKGRIFMQNVTDLVSLAKPGMQDNSSHLLIKTSERIFWKGDPSIENFIIRFTTEEALKKWNLQIDAQRRKYHERGSTTRNSDGKGTSATQFSYMTAQADLPNPYREEFDGEDEEDDTSTVNGTGYSHDEFRPLKSDWTNSTSSIRSRSTTGSSFNSTLGSTPAARAPAPRFPPGTLSQQQPLTLRTRELQQIAQSPGSDRGGESYFSPVETPMSSMSHMSGVSSSMASSRTSASSGMYPFPRQMPPQSNEYHQDGHGATRYTAPAMGRSQQQHQQYANGSSNGYAPPGRGPMPRPGYPAPGSGMHSAQQLPMQAARNRSVSSPDVHNGGPRAANLPQPPVPNLPASYQYPISTSASFPAPPSQQQQQHGGINRSNNSSPNIYASGRGSPQTHRERQYSRQEYSPTDRYAHGGPAAAIPPPLRPTDSKLSQQHSMSSIRTGTPVSLHNNSQEMFSPPPPPPPPQQQIPAPISTAAPAPFADFANPASPGSLKVKIVCPSAEQTLVIVVPANITYDLLKDRIDAKLQRSTHLSLTEKLHATVVKLKYLDERDLVSIQSDEDVQAAFEAWREQHPGEFLEEVGGMGEVELYCQK